MTWTVKKLSENRDRILKFKQDMKEIQWKECFYIRPVQRNRKTNVTGKAEKILGCRPIQGMWLDALEKRLPV